jgi:guanylate kinase
MKTGELVRMLREYSHTYQPNSGIARELRRKTIVPIIGPTAVGKSTVIEVILQSENDFSGVATITTRPKRDDESAPGWRFLTHDGEHLRDIVARVKAGELVQYAVHPTTGYIYATELQDYPKSFNVIAMLSSAMADIEKLPFKACKPIALVTAPADWEEWFMHRGGTTQNPDDAAKRLREAQQSIVWLLNHDEAAWVCNRPGEATRAARDIIRIVREGGSSDMSARRMGEQLLAHIDILLEERRYR